MKKPISEIARTIRSKNAGSNFITLEIIFNEMESYERVKKSGVITEKLLGELYKINANDIKDLVFFDHGMGIKANIRRKIPSGGPGETDVYGCQQYAPLFAIEIPWD